jgi:hypothetical protein
MLTNSDWHLLFCVYWLLRFLNCAMINPFLHWSSVVLPWFLLCYSVYAPTSSYPPTNFKPAQFRVQARNGWKANLDSEFACF